MGSLANQTLPTITFSQQNLKPGSSSWISTSKEVVRALEEFGSFIVNYSNFSPELHHAIFGATEELIDLPTHVKKRNTSDKPSHRYVGKESNRPLVEALGIERASTEEGVQSFTDLMWPSGNDSFRETVLGYSKVTAKLDEVVMRMVSEYYGITKSYETLRENTTYLLRLLKYSVPTRKESEVGIVPYTDKSFTTILHQYQVKGLQIQTKNGDWISVEPSPSAFVFMTGDAFTGWTNGRIEAPYHKVIMDGSEDRYSAGLFSFINGVEIQVAEELVDGDHPLQFKHFDNYKFIEFIYTEEGRKAECPLRKYCGV